MNQLDETAFRKFANGLSEGDRLFLIKEYRQLAKKLHPLTKRKPSK